MNLFIVSDLHIQGPEDVTYRALLTLLNERLTQNDILVLAGDIFDLFVGRKAIFRKRYREFFLALRKAGEKGAQVHYVEGNHDFLIHRAFAGIPGLQVHPREVALELRGKRFLIVHGDTVDRSDYGYRMLRRIFRSFLMKIFLWAVPGAWIDRIGKSSSKYSRGKKPAVPSELSLERRERLRKVFRSFAAEKLADGYDFVAMGHCHDLDEMIFRIGGRTGQYVNVGFPPVHGSMLTWSAGEERIHRTPLGRCPDPGH